MFLETFCILCLIFTVGYFIIPPVKDVWDKLPSVPASEDCGVKLNSDATLYELWFRGKTIKENQWAFVTSSANNRVESLKKNENGFVAKILREEYPIVGPVLKSDLIRASNLKKLAWKIEMVFENWDKEDL